MTTDHDFIVVVVAYRSREPLVGFLDSIGAEIPVVVVNNSMAEDDLRDLIDPRDNVSQVDAGGNLGFSAGANLGADHTEAPFVVFMNPDTLPRQGELTAMVDTLKHDRSVASCGANGVATAGGGALPTVPRVLAHVLGLHRFLGTAGLYFYPKDGRRRDVGWISGSCLAVRRTDFDAVGGFDEDYFVFMSDFDLGRKFVGANRRQVLLGDVIVEHFDGGSSDLPSEWTWQQRGKGWGQYINRTMSGFDRWAVGALLRSGFGVRRLVYAVLRRRLKVMEMQTMTRAITAELKNG